MFSDISALNGLEWYFIDSPRIIAKGGIAYSSPRKNLRRLHFEPTNDQRTEQRNQLRTEKLLAALDLDRRS
jgi:hypothetical protein